jgi:hypothetical protein
VLNDLDGAVHQCAWIPPEPAAEPELACGVEHADRGADRETGINALVPVVAESPVAGTTPVRADRAEAGATAARVLVVLALAPGGISVSAFEPPNRFCHSVIVGSPRWRVAPLSPW